MSFIHTIYIMPHSQPLAISLTYLVEFILPYRPPLSQYMLLFHYEFLKLNRLEISHYMYHHCY